MSKRKPSQNNQLIETDPFFGLKFIAYCRSQQPPEDVERDDIDIINYAKWSICKSRNILFKDPIWDEYTAEEILVEFFTIQFDESEQLRDQFLAQVRGVETKDLDWLDQMEAKYLTEREEKIKEELGGQTEFEDTF